MTTVASFRIDIGELQPVKRLPNGRIRVDARIARTGVLIYHNADGTERREYRAPSEVFSPAALASFETVPVTNDHPPMHLDATNAKQYAVGLTGEAVKRDGDYVRTTLNIYDAATVAAMEMGKLELSCGYAVDVVHTPGISPEGEPYDAIQTNIRGDHVAVVEAGRAGPMARARMDAAGGGEQCAIMVSTPTRRDVVAQRNPMDELTKQLTDALAAIAAEKARADAAEKTTAAEKARADKLEAERDDARARADKAEKARTDADASIADRVAARVALNTAALAVFGAETKLDAMSDREIKCAVVEKIHGVKIPAEKSDDYVAARFDAATEVAGKAAAGLGAVRAAAEETKVDAGDAEKAAQERMRKASMDAWKNPKESE